MACYHQLIVKYKIELHITQFLPKMQIIYFCVETKPKYRSIELLFRCKCMVANIIHDIIPHNAFHSLKGDILKNVFLVESNCAII